MVDYFSVYPEKFNSNDRKVAEKLKNTNIVMMSIFTYGAYRFFNHLYLISKTGRIGWYLDIASSLRVLCLMVPISFFAANVRVTYSFYN